MNHDINLIDASDEEVKAAFMGATKSPISFRYEMNIVHNGHKRRFEFVTRGLELPLRHSDKMEAKAQEQLETLQMAKSHVMKNLTTLPA